MKAFLAGVQEMDIDITPMVRAGEPRKTIIDVAERLPADLLIIGAHSKRSVFNVVLGGTAGYVSRHARCPVLMVTPRKSPRHRDTPIADRQDTTAGTEGFVP